MYAIYNKRKNNVYFEVAFHIYIYIFLRYVWGNIFRIFALTSKYGSEWLAYSNIVKNCYIQAVSVKPFRTPKRGRMIPWRLEII